MKNVFINIVTVAVSMFLAFSLVIIVFPHNTSFLSKDSAVEKTTLIQKPNAPLNWEFELFYSDINLSDISKVTYSKDGITKNPDILSAYASGFLETSYLNNINEMINLHRSSLGLQPITPIFSHHKLNQTIIVATSSGLDTLYIIDETNNKVFSPILASDSAYLPQYIYKIIEDASNYYILTAGVNNLDARLFSLSKSSFTLYEISNVTTDNTALSSMQYVLLNSRTGLFTNTRGVQTSLDTIIPLDFSPDALFNDSTHTVAIKLNENNILVSLIDTHSLSLIKTTTLPSVSPNLSIVDGCIDNNYLYLFTYDGYHPNYYYYLNIYDLATDELVFCEALSDYNGLRILDINPTFNNK